MEEESSWFLGILIVIIIFGGILTIWPLTNLSPFEQKQVSPFEQKQVIKYAKVNLNLRGPGEEGVLRVLPKGTKVIVLREEGEWSWVEVDNQQGWVATQYLETETEKIAREQKEVEETTRAEAKKTTGEQKEITELRRKVEELEKKLEEKQTKEPADLPSLVNQWRPIVPYVECEFWIRYLETNQLYYKTFGSGVALNFHPLKENEEGYVMVATNKHILINSYGDGAYSCKLQFPDISYPFRIYTQKLSVTIKDVDGGWIKIDKPVEYMFLKNLEFPNLCKRRPSLGEKIIVLGYPVIGAKSDITVTEGIISGYEGEYYITSAKIDQGNSGGAAILVEDNCLLGIPTYALMGEIESLGRILRIQAIWE